MKKINNICISFISAIGMLSMLVTPIFVIVIASIFREQIPLWITITGYSLSACDLIFILFIILTWVFEKDSKKDE